MKKNDKLGRPKLKESEKKLKRITIRFTYKEYIDLIKNKPSNLGDVPFFRMLISKSNPIFFDYNKLDNYLSEIKKIGVNLNQITKKINSLGVIDIQNYYELSEKIQELNNIYFNILEELNSK